jgi:nicotinate-nucleotide pyrophosphorylase (carboxylating)
VIAGAAVVRNVYERIDPRLRLVIVKQDGTVGQPGETVIELSGSTRSILTGERVALNFLQHLAGIATLTAQFVAAVRGTGVTILDTRKTTPGLRVLEKAAVLAGGGRNHRMGLYDGIMVKDNHLLAKPELEAAIRSARLTYPNILIELEADSIEQVRKFVLLKGVDVILLDNMSPDELRACVSLRRPGLKFEASGGVELMTVRQIAEAGVDFISVGQLTHSAKAIDFSLELSDAQS